ncbi:MAG: PD-(D/E)XK nuclease family protein, partial [Nanoarchaeota archaeon]|nr:PD-(D/E)XK nuclease family protein [Nanoarchaeota archaeon]
KFKLTYIDKEEPEGEESIEAFVGSRVHEALEWLYKRVKMTVVPTKEQVLEYFEKRWKKNFHPAIKINNEEFLPEHYFSKGKKFIEDYYERYKPFKENTIAMEKLVRIDLDGTGKYKMIGYVDRLVYNKDSKSYEIHDYKTANRLSEQSELEQDRQLALYCLAVKSMYPDANKVCLIWHFLAFDKEFCIFKTDKQLGQLKKEVIKVIQEIERAKKSGKFPASQTALCDWCEYKSLCPQFKHEAELEKKPVNEYLKDDGVKLVNKYAEIYSKKKDIELELDKIKEAVIEYSKKKGIEVVFGSNNKISVKFSKKFKFPAKGTEERQELESLLKKLKKWDEVAALDTFALEKELDEWPAEVVKKIKKFGSEEDSVSVRLSKLKEGEE